MIVAVVPVKRLLNAKQRLAGVLDESKRVDLMLAMLGDVLVVLRRVKRIDSVVVIGSDERVRAVATDAGTNFVWKSPKAGNLNRAIEEAVASHTGADDVALILPADVPAVNSDDLERLLALQPQRGIVVVPAIDGGTNALLLSPAGIIHPQFGPNSAERHAQEAELVGATAQVLAANSLSRDIDNCDDLYWALDAAGTGARTREFLDREVSPQLARGQGTQVQSVTGA